MELNYRRNGGYYYPALSLDGEGQILYLEKYGRMRLKFLREKKNGMYMGMLLDGSLMKHLLEIQEAADQRLDKLTMSLAKAQGASEMLKEQDPMRWVGLMNNIRSRAEEVVMREYIYEED